MGNIGGKFASVPFGKAFFGYIENQKNYAVIFFSAANRTGVKLILSSVSAYLALGAAFLFGAGGKALNFFIFFNKTKALSYIFTVTRKKFFGGGIYT